MPNYIFELCFILLSVILFLPNSRKVHIGAGLQANCNLLSDETPIAKRFLIVSFALLGFMIMFRDITVGNDTVMYVKEFRRYDCWDFNNRYEVGYNILQSLTKLVCENKYAIIVTSGAITTFLFYDFIKRYSNYYFLSIVFFIFLNFWGDSLNIMRQTLACSVLTYSYRFILSNKFIKFLITVLIATSFHSSAILFLCAWPIKFIRINNKTILYLIIGVIAAYASFSVLLRFSFMIDDSYEGYASSIYGEGNRIGALFQASCYIGLVLFALFLRAKIGGRKFSGAGLDIPLLFSFLGAVILLMSYNMSIFGRIAQYFNVFELILLPNVIRLLPANKQRLITFLLFIYVNIFFWMTQILRPEWNLIFPYHTSIDF